METAETATADPWSASTSAPAKEAVTWRLPAVPAVICTGMSIVDPAASAQGNVGQGAWATAVPFPERESVGSAARLASAEGAPAATRWSMIDGRT